MTAVLAVLMVAVALGTVFLDELLTIATAIGFLLVVAGCWLATRPPPDPSPQREMPTRLPSEEPAW